jgi:hypothetical protein
MASIRKEVLIDAASQRGLGRAQRRRRAAHASRPGFVTDTRLEPGARVVTFGNGQVVRELIVDLDEKDRRLVWAVVDKPFQHYSASAQVFDDGPGNAALCGLPTCFPTSSRSMSPA